MDADAYFWIASVLKTNGGIGLDPGSHAMIAEKIAEQRERIRELEQQLTAAREREGDVKRYAFLRNDPPTNLCVRMARDGCQAIYTDGAELDAAIDAALSHEQAQQEAGE